MTGSGYSLWNSAITPSVQADDRGLIWAGDTQDVQVTPTSQPDSPEPQPTTLEEPSTQVEPLTEPHTPDAERRQLTVMFVDMVGSTELSSQLDPEDYREVVREYQKACTEVIERFDGYVAQYLGDGVLVYFGYPQSHEDEAQRAVYTGLGILNGIKQLNARLERDKAIRLGLRVGIHTGLVVIGEMGEGSRQEQLALGEVPNVAARIQGLAEPDTVIISDKTYRLIQGYFECESLGEQTLRGVADPIVVYHVLGESGVQSRLDVASTRGLTPLVGREQEVGLLLDRWSQTKNSQGQVVLLSGEGGIGKSRLVQVLKDHMADEAHTRLECRSSPYYQNTALYPITDLLERTLRFRVDDTPVQRLERLEQELGQYRLPLEETVPLFLPLLSLSPPGDRYPPLNFSPQRQRQKTLEAILAIILELSERQPVLFILEDLHWTDPTTLEFLELLIEQTPTTSVYILTTCRPEFQPSWSHRSYLTEVTLNHLSRKQIERLAEHVADGKRLPAEVLDHITEKTDGVPLFVEELTKAVLETGALKDVDGSYELIGTVASWSIPSTLQDSLMARLDRLMTAKGIAQLGAAIGRQFSYELLHAVSQVDEDTLHKELSRLVEAELLYQRGLPPQATYTFKHALIQDTAYESLLRSTRQGYHHRIAEVLAELFPETAEIQPELLAHHYTGAGLHAQAVAYLQQAGQHAIEGSAHAEAVAHLTRGLDGLKALPETHERVQRELDLQITLALALHALKGQAAPDVERAYARARELCRQTEDVPQLFRALLGLYRFYGGIGKYQTSGELVEQLVSLAQRTQDPDLLLEAYMARGTNLLLLGELVAARSYLEQGIALYSPQPHRSHIFRYSLDPGAVCLSRASWVLWLLGYPDQALRSSQETLVLARELAHPHNLTIRQICAAMFHLFRHERQAASDQVEAAVTLLSEQGSRQYQAAATLLQGWILAAQGQRAEGIAQMQQGLATYRATGTEMYRPYYLALLAEGYGLGGKAEKGLSVLAEALAAVDSTGERWCEAELRRLKGELLFQQSPDNATEAETCFHQAITVAQNQSAKSWELRAATRLAKLWQSQDKRQDAYHLLAPVYNWFTEGFDTADLKDAKALVDELA